MLAAVVDTNVLVAGVLTRSLRSASRRLVDRHRSGEFTLLLSPATLTEIQEVLALPQLRAMHHLTDDEIRLFCLRLEFDKNTRVLAGTRPVSPSVTRDVSDTKWVALALEGHTDYLVTNDHRHLHRLRMIGRTRIVTPHKFLQALDEGREVTK
jgi:putative PIN family toxin of toxin-antitoxin system